MTAIETAIETAMWAGDTAALHRLAPCECCCEDHTWNGCPARVWNACRGQGALLPVDIAGWAAHYGVTVDA